MEQKLCVCYSIDEQPSSGARTCGRFDIDSPRGLGSDRILKIPGLEVKGYETCYKIFYPPSP
jgi:hypothetical protein